MFLLPNYGVRLNLYSPSESREIGALGTQDRNKASEWSLLINCARHPLRVLHLYILNPTPFSDLPAPSSRKQ
jgi:hypothetical protein